MINRKIEIRNKYGKEVSNKQITKELEKKFGRLDNIKGHKFELNATGMKILLNYMENKNTDKVTGDYMTAYFEDFTVSYIKIDKGNEATIIIDKVTGVFEDIQNVWQH